MNKKLLDMRQIENKLRLFIKNNRKELLALACVSFYFYVQMINAGISTHDDLINIYKVRMGTFFEELQWLRWGVTFMSAIPSYLSGACKTQITYRILTLLGLLASSLSLALFLRKITGKKTPFIFLILFFLFAQIQLDHDGLISFSCAYQLNTAYVFLGMAVFCDYLKTQKKPILIISAILYLLSSMAYEAFLLYGILFFIIDLKYLSEKKEISVKKLIADLWIHAGAVIVYVLSYIFVRTRMGLPNADSTVGTNISLHDVMITIWRLSTGMAPLSYRGSSLCTLLRASLELSILNVCRWIMIILVMIEIGNAIRLADKISTKNYIFISFFCLVGMLLPTVLIALTDQAVNWICNGIYRSYGISYYSYFFIIAWIAITVVFIYQRIPIKKMFLIFALICIAFISEFTFLDNDEYIQLLADQENKYDLWCSLIETDHFKEIEKGAQIYAPDYSGIHYDMNTLANYANHESGTSVTTTNNEKDLNYQGPVYYLDIDTKSAVVYMSKIDEQGYTNEVYIYALDDITGYGIVADLKDSNDATKLIVNGKIINSYDDYIVAPTVNASGHELLVNCKDIKANTVEVYRDSSGFDSGKTKGN